MELVREQDVEIVGRIEAVPMILDTVRRITGMGFAAVARVTAQRWLACAVDDGIAFGLKAGGDLKLDSTICDEIRQTHRAVVIPDTLADPLYRDHHTPRIYGFRSYVSYPILLADGSMWGTLCAIDPDPRDLERPEIRNVFKMFADLIGFHLNMTGLLDASEADLGIERASGLQREQFIAVLGHDLRNPLAAVQSGITLLRKKPGEERAALLLGGMQASVDRMVGLVDDILDFSRGRMGGGIPLRLVQSDAVALVRRVVEELASTRPDIAILVETDPAAIVSCDPERVEQLVSNLVGNAITHGDPALPIHVTCHVRDGRLSIAVANGGGEIQEAARAALFQPYERGGQSDARSGLGLGLYIASTIARAHGGELTVASSPEETCFTFSMALPG